MLKKLMVLLAIIAMLFVGIGCSGDDDDNGDPNGRRATEDVIIPLAVGNYWDVESREYLNDSLTSSNTGRTVITASYDLEGIVAYLLSAESNPNVGTLFANLDDGLYFMGSINEDDFVILDAPILFYKYPGNVGDSSGRYYEIANTSSIQDVPAGRFTCYEYTDERLLRVYFSPGYGFIRDYRESEEEIGDYVLHFVEISELLDFDVSNRPGPPTHSLPTESIRRISPEEMFERPVSLYDMLRRPSNRDNR